MNVFWPHQSLRFLFPPGHVIIKAAKCSGSPGFLSGAFGSQLFAIMALPCIRTSQPKSFTSGIFSRAVRHPHPIRKRRPLRVSREKTCELSSPSGASATPLPPPARPQLETPKTFLGFRNSRRNRCRPPDPPGSRFSAHTGLTGSRLAATRRVFNEFRPKAPPRKDRLPAL